MGKKSTTPVKKEPFRAVIETASVFKGIIESIKDLITEANLEVSKEGIYLQSMDTSHVSLVHLFLGKNGFEEFNCEEKLSLGINFGSLMKILKCASNSDRVVLSCDKNKDKLNVEFQNDKKSQDFDLKLLEIDSETLGIPETEYQCKIKLESSEFLKTCKNHSLFGDSVLITVRDSGSGLEFYTKGESSGTKTVLKSTEDLMVTNEEETNLRMEFALRYLMFFSKATSLADKMKIKLSPEVPAVLTYKVMGGHGFIKYYLAPKIEEQ